jgi:uncharacterized membrane protein HdeD (DUF308 family)
MGVGENAARAKASELVRDARETFARMEPPRSWWSIALRGVLAIVAGFILLQRPIETVAAIVLVLGAWILVDGVITLASAIMHRTWSTAPEGAIGVIIGYLIFTRPSGAMIVFFVLAAAWALARGAAEIGLAMKMDKGEPGRTSLLVLGAVSFAFGILLLVAPALGMVTLGWWIGAYALIYGVVSVMRAFQVRKVREEVKDLWHGRPRAPLPA